MPLTTQRCVKSCGDSSWLASGMFFALLMGAVFANFAVASSPEQAASERGTVGGAMVESAMLEGASLQTGRKVFNRQCVLCHGHLGCGDGRLAAQLTPRPANLVKSRLSNAELKAIISQGGDAVGRSSSMPAWQEELTLVEIDSLILFIHQLRKLK
jgi:mono/diheme cytochrome c family protein